MHKENESPKHLPAVPHHDFSGDLSDLPVLDMNLFESSVAAEEGGAAHWDGDKKLGKLALGEMMHVGPPPTPDEVTALYRKSLTRELGLDENGRRQSR